VAEMTRSDVTLC